QEKAKEWHKSPEGREWHRQHAKNTGFGIFEPVESKCENCNNIFKKTKSYNKFCSNSCTQKYYYKTKKYHETRECSFCGKDFSVRKNEKTQACSRSCSGKLRRGNR